MPSTLAWTPPLLACQHGHSDAARLLIEGRADPNQPVAGTHYTPMFVAAREGHAAILSLLATFGARVPGSTPRTDTETAEDFARRVARSPINAAFVAGHFDLARWLTVASDWPQFWAAVACRHPELGGAGGAPQRPAARPSSAALGDVALRVCAVAAPPPERAGKD